MLIGYPSLADAYTALRNDPDVRFRTWGSWNILSEPKSGSVWYFGMDGEKPAHVIRRSPVAGQPGKVRTDVSCTSNEIDCQAFFEEFKALVRAGE